MDLFHHVFFASMLFAHEDVSQKVCINLRKVPLLTAPVCAARSRTLNPDSCIYLHMFNYLKK